MKTSLVTSTLSRTVGFLLSTCFCVASFAQPGGGGTKTAPGVFSLISPANGASQVSLTPTFTWGSSSGASTYTFQVSSLNSFSSLLHQATGISRRTPRYTLPAGVLTGGSYYWRVIAVNSIGQSVAGNSPFSFSTAGAVDTTAPVVTVSHSPSNPTNTQQVTYTATASDTSGIYQISLYVDGALVNTSSLTATCSYTGGPYASGTTHYYYATAFDNSAGHLQGTSTTSSFVISNKATTNFLGACWFMSATNVIATGVSGTEVLSTDGGLSWTNHPTGLTNNLNDVSFYDSNNGLMLAANTISGSSVYRTTNGGLTWVYKASFAATLQSVSFKSANFAVIAGNSGTILKSTDGGTTWTTQVSGTTQNLYSLHFVDQNTGTAVGAYGTIVRSTNGGMTWVPQTSGVLNFLRGVHFIDANTGTAVGDNGTIVRTTNGGSAWTQQSAPAATGWALYAVKFTTVNHGVIGGQNLLLHTTDGGASWSSQTVPATIAELSFRDTTTGIAVGSYGAILRTTDGGSTWVTTN